MKSAFRFTAVALAVLCAAMHADGENKKAEAAEKIGYVDLARVFDEYNMTKDLDKQLETKGSGKQGERDRMVAEIKKLRDEAELLSAKAKEDKQAGIDDKLKVLQDFDRTTRDALRKERDVMVRDILKQIEVVIQDFGKAQGYGYIFNDRVLVYKGEGNDLTESVITTLNANYAKKK
jgi:outer membrane protein